jgi:hypothetical protein
MMPVTSYLSGFSDLLSGRGVWLCDNIFAVGSLRIDKCMCVFLGFPTPGLFWWESPPPLPVTSTRERHVALLHLKFQFLSTDLNKSGKFLVTLISSDFFRDSITLGHYTCNTVTSSNALKEIHKNVCVWW